MKRLLLLAILAAALGLAIQKYQGGGSSDDDTEAPGFLDLGVGSGEEGEGGGSENSDESWTTNEEARPIETEAVAGESFGGDDLIDLSAGPEAAPRQQEAYTFEAEVIDPRRLALLLTDSWNSKNADSLQRYLNGGEGTQLPAGRRKLVGHFWRAMNGDRGQAQEWLDDLGGDADVRPEQLGLLRRALGLDQRAVALEASSGRVAPLTVAMREVLLDAEASVARKDGRLGVAATALSALVMEELDAPWDARLELLVEWARTLNGLQNQHRLNSAGDWPFFEYEVEHGDSLVTVRKKLVDARPGLLLCVGLLRATNDLASDTLQPGQRLRVPTDAPNVLVDLSARLLLYRQGDEIVRIWTVGIGKEGHETPVGAFTAGEKLENPSYMPVGRQQLPFGHPENPLGTFWVGWYRDGVKTSYGFHGTSDASGVGKRVSQGCIRMRNEDVEELAGLLPIGSQIRIRP